MEGKYDKIKLESILEADIMTTDGFGIFKGAEKRFLLRRIAERNGLIVLTDSDGAGLVIRNYLNSVIPKDKLIHLYIPEIHGKENRKKSPSKSGLLGVEGISAEKIREVFLPFADDNFKPRSSRKITKRDFFDDGLSGAENSSELRKRLTVKLGFPSNMSSNALLNALNLLYSYEEYQMIIKDIDGND